jgi:DNA-binding GntR family transcriptional regulator
MTDEQVAGVRTAIERLEAVGRDHHLPRFWKLHGEFHWALLKPGASAWIRRIVDQTSLASQRYVRLFVSETLDDAMADHRELLARSKARDGCGPAALLRRHLDRTEHAVVQAFAPAHGAADRN